MKPETKTALLWALKRGLCLFPIRPGTKDEPLCRWREESSSDHARINHWLKQHPGCNWGVDCGKSGLFVFDVDTKNGHHGDLSALALLEANELRDTIPDEWCSIRTPSGGMQYWMLGATKNSAGDMGDGLDVRSVGGYVLLPSSGDKRGSYALINDRPFIPAPQWLLDLAGQATERSSEASRQLVDWDDPINVAKAMHWLANEAPEPLPGERDHSCYAVGARLREMGISVETAVHMAVEYWWPRWGDDSFSADEVEAPISHAYDYAKSPAGAATPAGREILAAEALPDLPPEEPEETPAKDGSPLRFFTGASLLTTVPPPTSWLLGHRLVGGYVNLYIAAGGVGKSTVSFADALSVASGKPLLGDRVYRTGRTWLCNLEDGADELARRLLAAAKHYSLMDNEILSRVILSSGPDHQKVILVRMENNRPTVCDKTVARIIRFVKDNEILLIFADPFVRSHGVSENDNMAIDLVVQQWDKIAKETGAAVVVVHHTRKRGDNDSPGDADKIRGAGALVNAARMAWDLNRMTDKEAKAFGIDATAGDHLDYIRMDNAKTNLAPPAKKARWFRLVSVGLDNASGVYEQDFRATLEPADLEGEHGGRVEDLILWSAAERLLATGMTTFDDLYEALCSDPLWPEMERREATTLITSVLATHGTIGGRYRLDYDKKTKLITLEEEI